MVDAKALSDAARRIGPALMPQLLDLVQGINALAIERNEAQAEVEPLLMLLRSTAIERTMVPGTGDPGNWLDWVQGLRCQLCGATVAGYSGTVAHAEECRLHET